MRTRVILSIEGCGARGLIPVRFLEALAQRLSRRGKVEPIHRYVDLVCGTSAGGLIAAALAAPAPGAAPGTPALDIAALRNLFEVELEPAFRCEAGNRVARFIRNPIGVADRVHDARTLEMLLKSVFGHGALSSSLVPLLLPVYDIEARAPLTLSGGVPAEADHYTYEAVRASLATPTVFEPALVEDLRTRRLRSMIDGVLYAADPVLVALLHARREPWWGQEPVLVLSLGQGTRLGDARLRGYAHDRAAAWGPIGWIGRRTGHPLLSITAQGQASVTVPTARAIVEAAGGRYLRLDGDLGVASERLDDMSPTNMSWLNEAAERIVRRHVEDLEVVADLLEAREEPVAA